MRKILILLEDPSKINEVVQGSADKTRQSLIISLTPGTSHTLENAGIPYKSVGTYSSGDERYQEGMRNFQRIFKISSIMDTELAHIYVSPSIRPAEYSIYNLKILFDVLWNTVLVLKQVVDKEQPDFIRLYTLPNKGSDTSPYAFSDTESAYAEILSMPGWNIPIEIIRDSAVNPENTAGERPKINPVHSWIRKWDFLFNLGLINKRKGLVPTMAAAYYHITCRYRVPVLIYNNGYNWDDSLVELYQQGMTPYRIHDDSFPASTTGTDYRGKILDICRTHPGMREFCLIGGVDISPFLFERISQIVERSIRESSVAYPAARRTIQEKKICCLLHSVREHPTGHAIVQAAIDEEIPVVSWQHGGAGFCFHPMMPFIEFINSGWHFVFGKGVAESYYSTSKKIELKNIPVFLPVGSSSLEEFSQNSRRPLHARKRTTVVYISTHYLQNIYIMSQPCDPLAWNDKLWQMQKLILELANMSTDTDFIIKLHPTHADKEPLQGFVANKRILNVKIVTTEMTLHELVDIAHIIVFDLISTGILQVLTSGLPVFVYTGLHEIDSEAILLLKKRAYTYENSWELIEDLSGYIRTHTVPGKSVDTSDKHFMQRFGTGNMTKTSADQALSCLTKILNGENVGGDAITGCIKE
ncbi:MAG: hypothetical protein METHP_00002 [Methanoregula sp. SKADARSKE-2]|nr:MAG: hypothetical protein METHP_00002 [Methanoregula sp. SKADARSKE-2]